MKPIKICFISLRSYPLFIKESSGYFGGAEVQMSILARELAKDEHFVVSVITGDYGQPRLINQNKLTLFKLFDFFKILKIVEADIYVERTVNPKVLLVGCCRRLFKKIKTLAESLPNIKFLEAVRAAEILDFFRQAKILVNTSTAEGFPNTFLQAGAARTPVLSFRVNPDNYIIKYRCDLVGRRGLKLMLVRPC